MRIAAKSGPVNNSGAASDLIHSQGGASSLEKNFANHAGHLINAVTGTKTSISNDIEEIQDLESGLLLHVGSPTLDLHNEVWTPCYCGRSSSSCKTPQDRLHRVAETGVL